MRRITINMKNEMLKNILKYMTPPGNGVFTVHTAKENKDILHNKLYQTADPKVVQEKWEKSLNAFEKNSKVSLLGVTLDTGGGIQRGANWGPLFIRTKLEYNNLFDLGDIKTIPHLLHDKYLNTQTIKSCQQSLYQEENELPVSALSITEHFCNQFYQSYPEKKLLALGGDHSVSYALVKPWLIHKSKQGKKVAIIHFDAHTDLMQSRLGIDICFASWAYHMIEYLDQAENLIQLGIRSSGQNKEYWENSLGIKQYWADEINQNTQKIIDKIIEQIKANNIQEVYMSFDIDALDTEYASATGTPEKQGLSPHDCCQIIDEIARHTQVTGADLVEVAPFVQSSKKGLSPEPETTLLSAKIIIDKFIEVMS